MRRRLTVSSSVVLLLLLSVPMAGSAATTAPSEASAVPTLRAIRAAHHPGFDRLVFDFTGGLPARTSVRWVDRVVQDGSGLPLRVAGSAFLEISLFPVRGHTDTGASTYGARRRAYDLPNVATVVQSGDFEAVVSFGVGLMARTSILRTMRLRDPDRFVVDVRTDFPRTRVRTWLFDEDRFVGNTPPFFRPVRRWVPVPAVARGALHRIYAGPTPAEIRSGLRLLRSGSSGFSAVRVASGVATVRLRGGCSSGGSTVTVAGLVTPTLRQFPTVRWVKILAPDGTTARPLGPVDSIPACLEP